MNQATTAGWSPMVAGPDEDFANFLEFGDLQLGFNPLEGLHQDDGKAQEHGDIAMDIPLDPALDASMNLFGFDEGQVHQQQQQAQDQVTSGTADQNTNLDFYSMPHIPNLPSQPHSQHQQSYQNIRVKHREFYGRSIIPPTPKSMEMGGGHAQYYHSPSMYSEQAYEHLRQRQRNNMVFTPLVSPAVTPLDTQFRRVEHQAPGESFSPLTSPALAGRTSTAPKSSTIRSSDTSDTTSPIDLNTDAAALPDYSNTGPVRKSRRKTMPTPKSASRSVKQSPVMKSQGRRKQGSRSKLTPKEISTIMENAEQTKLTGVTPVTTALGNLPLPCSSQDSSEVDSVSPEPLSEVLMPPPATPRSNSAGKSPHISAQQTDGSLAATKSKKEPATPASLMRIQRQKSRAVAKQQSGSNLGEGASMAETGTEQILDDIALPGPAKTSSRPVLSPIDTSNANDSEATPTLSARKTPITTASAPLTATGFQFPSPQVGDVASPGGSILPSKRSDPSRPSGRDSKKRHGNSSSQVSPAIRPRISPSIKPLLPDGAVVSPETSALLLASKSNYQNILEGTHLPGVSYPETLSTNLTSKRTSHKIAEQGRRNRINLALQEIASLLPPTLATANGAASNGSKSSGGEGKEGSENGKSAQQTAAQQSNSKASTVEMAIDYIKDLRGEVQDLKAKMVLLEKELAEKNKEG